MPDGASGIMFKVYVACAVGVVIDEVQANSNSAEPSKNTTYRELARPVANFKHAPVISRVCII